MTLTLALISAACLAWFAAQWFALRANERRDLWIASMKTRLDAFEDRKGIPCAR